MKTIFLGSLIFLSLITCAQNTDTHFGIKAGLNIASMDVKNGVDFNSKAGFNFGGLAHVHISPHLAVQPEVVYSQQGGTDGNEKWKISYINVPVLFQYMAGDGFRVQTGPQFGFKTGAKIKNGDVEVENHDVSTFDFSWAIGASYILPEGIGIDARYNVGLTNLNDEDAPIVKNRVFQFGLFYQFINPMHKHHGK